LQYLIRNKRCFTNLRGIFDREFAAMKLLLLTTAVSIGSSLVLAAANATTLAENGGLFVLAQANIPPTGMGDNDMAMATANMAEDERMKRRYPQPIRVSALIGARVSDNDSRTIGTIRQVVRTAQGKVEVVVDCCGWFGFGSRQVVVPIAVLGVFGREVASLDWERGAYAGAPAWQMSDWQHAGGTVLADDESVRIALARR
jgi:hypothetical protein